MIVFEASYTSSSHSAQAAYTNEYKIGENCQISTREIWAHKTQDKNKHNTTQKNKEMSNLNPTTSPEGTQVFMKCKQLLYLSYKTPAMLLIYI
jgi:hypothetical protein